MNVTNLDRVTIFDLIVMAHEPKKPRGRDPYATPWVVNAELIDPSTFSRWQKYYSSLRGSLMEHLNVREAEDWANLVEKSLERRYKQLRINNHPSPDKPSLKIETS